MGKKIGNIITSIIMVILVLMACVLYVPKFFGITPMVVLSGSMEPTYHVGSLIFVDKSNASNLNVGDNVTFHYGDTTSVVTHRIVEKNKEEKYFITKGDNNNSKDKEKLSYSNVIGKAASFSIPFMGYIATYLNTTSGFIMLIVFAAIVILITILLDFNSKKKGAK